MVRIAGYQKLTLLDYKGMMACILFVGGCNYRCSYCQNYSLLTSKDNYYKEIIEYLTLRKNMLDAVVVTGGEPTLYKDLISLLVEIKKLGYKIKLDTNGSNSKLLKEIIDGNLVDYIAMDIKHILSKYDVVTKVTTNIDEIKKSINIINNSKIEHEFRTTIIKGIHNIEDLKEINNMINKANYYIQNFEMSDDVMDKKLKSFSKDELAIIENKLKEISNIIIR